jgi:hypothetical protein
LGFILLSYPLTSEINIQTFTDVVYKMKKCNIWSSKLALVVVVTVLKPQIIVIFQHVSQQTTCNEVIIKEI